MVRNKGTKRSHAWRFALLSIVVLLFAAVCGGAVYGYWTVFEHRFSTVSEGQVYRSGGMPPEQLVNKVRQYGIRAVIDLRRDSSEMEEMSKERSILARLGVRHFHLPSQQIPTDETVDRFLEIMGHPEYRPVLIHCTHGEGRAVLFAAIYGMEFEGWSNERARSASRFLSFRGSFSPKSKKGIFIRNYIPRWRRENPKPD
jgi:protein tyrosine/serine phosphatase